MKRLALHSIALALLLTLVASVPASGKSRAFAIEGRVLHKNRKERTLLVKDRWSPTLYLVKVPPDARLKIKFGVYMGLTFADFAHVHKRDVISANVIRTGEHRYAKLDNGQTVVVVIAASLE